MGGYYSQRLSAERLRLCYELAPPKVQQYLQAEVDYVKERIQDSDRVLELGCGYGRVLQKLAAHARFAVGIDSSLESLVLARELLTDTASCCLVCMDAVMLGFPDGLFDTVVCIQNGISAFHVDQRQLVAEAVRVTRPGGKALFSSYADGFWEERLHWFRLQASHGLVGEIDVDATGNGVIVCRDGFQATTVGSEDFIALSESLGVICSVTEVDGSSLFCEVEVR